ncbi:MAG: alpha/beta fold hydrolase [Geminicoccaceae bacterium]
MPLVNVNGTELFVQIDGPNAAPWILCSNSLGATHRMWAPQMDVLTRHQRVLRYDTRGHGESAAPIAPYQLADLVSDVIGLMDHYDIETADVLGLSLGGMTGLGLALHHADRVKRLICCDARADAPPPFAKMWDERIAAVDAKGVAALWPGTLERWLTKACQAGDGELVDQLRMDFEMTSAEGYKGCAAAIRELDYLRHLGSIKRPTLYIVGDQDSGASPETMRAMADATPDAAFREIENAAHIANIDNTEAFNAAIASFLHPA